MNMTGDPNQEARSSVFGIDCNYPSAGVVDWNKYMPAPGAISNEYSSPFFPPSNNFSFSNTARPPPPVQFPFNTPPPSKTVEPHGDFGQMDFRPVYRCKRKTDSPPLDLPQKQFITDEKMAEHMSHLHINSETAVPSESQPVRERRLYLCEEMRRLQQESILPQSLLNRINRPCTALVLWTPPSRIQPVEEAQNNNDEGVLDNNVMDLDAMN